MSTFAEASKVTGSGLSYAALLSEGWAVNGNPHGGYLLAILGRAAIAADEARHPDPIAASATYIAPPILGEALLDVTPLRQGRSASQYRVRLVQAGTTRVEALFTLGTLDGIEQVFVDAPPVAVAPLEECPRIPVEPPGAGVRVSMLDTVDQRVDPASFEAGSGDLRGWLRFDDGTPFDPVSLLYVADSFPPATLTLGSIGWVPTLELTAYVRAVPAPGPLRVRQRVRALTGSVVDQVCEVWDSTDRVVAQASQLALVRLR